jgi:hypothetical protein
LATNPPVPLAVHSVDAPVVHLASVTAEQRRDPPVAEASKTSARRSTAGGASADHSTGHRHEDADGGRLGGHRLGARDRVELRGLALARGVPGLPAARRRAEPFEREPESNRATASSAMSC